MRGERVMLDFDLAALYQVETKSLNLSVKRNPKRFPPDFMFQLTSDEWNNLRLQNETSKHGGRRYLPYAFTEQGVSMLSGLLNSDKAIDANINIMRAFIAMRNYILHQASVSEEIEVIKERIKALEQAGNDNLTAINDLSEDTQRSLDDIYIALSELANKQKTINKPRPKIGYI
jgi:hypothetical protein